MLQIDILLRDCFCNVLMFGFSREFLYRVILIVNARLSSFPLIPDRTLEKAVGLIRASNGRRIAVQLARDDSKFVTKMVQVSHLSRFFCVRGVVGYLCPGRTAAPCIYIYIYILLWRARS